MTDPFSISLAALGHFLWTVGIEHPVGAGVHQHYEYFLERWREAAIDPATGLPHNHDLQRASLESLREAALVLVMELAGRLDEKKPWLPLLVEHVRAGKLFKVPLSEAGAEPQTVRRPWLPG